MALVDFNAMKSDKELFDNMADRLIKDTQKKKKHYAALYNKANMLKNEINRILVAIEELCFQNNIALSKDIHEYTFKELEDIHIDVEAPNLVIEQLKLNVYKIQIRLDEIKKLRSDMIKLDLYENHLSDMEDDTLDEEYIDMDKIREQRGITILDTLDKELEKFSYDDISQSDDEYYEYTFNGDISIKEVSKNMYGSPSYWVHIYNYSDNSEKINRVIIDECIDIDTIVNKPIYLKDIIIKLPKQIEFYSDEFNTAVLKEIF